MCSAYRPAHITQNREDAKTTCRDAFLKRTRTLPAVPGAESKFTPGLVRIAVNEALNEATPAPPPERMVSLDEDY